MLGIALVAEYYAVQLNQTQSRKIRERGPQRRNETLVQGANCEHVSRRRTSGAAAIGFEIFDAGTEVFCAR